MSKEVTCPRCGSRMKLRTAIGGRRPGKRFWGCSTYPKCRVVKEWRDPFVSIAELSVAPKATPRKRIRCTACDWTDIVDAIKAGEHMLFHKAMCQNRLQGSDRFHRKPKAKRIQRLGKSADMLRKRHCHMCREELTVTHDTLTCINGCLYEAGQQR